MDEMDQMISEIDTSVAPDLIKLAACMTVIVAAPHIGFWLLKKRREKNQIQTYTEFVNSKDQNARFYTNPSVN